MGMKECIAVQMNDSGFEYDVRSLLRAFFAGADVVFLRLPDDELDETIVVDSDVDSQLPDSVRNDTDLQMLNDAGNDGGADLVIRISEGLISLVWRGGEEKNVSVAGMERAGVKNALKRLIYDTLSVDVGRELPWGTLTGIRPTKLVLKKVREGNSFAEIEEFMRENYRALKEKTELAYQVAVREERIIRECAGDDSYSLYVGIPFCPSICLYCSFSSYPIGVYREKVDAYLDALFREIDFVAEAFGGRKLSTIYIGGGTPTSLSAEQLERLLTKIRDTLDLSDLREWTVEAGRPDSITEEKLEVIRRTGSVVRDERKHSSEICSAGESCGTEKGRFSGIRISINPQTFRQETLDRIGRQHSVEDAGRAFATARKVGFDCINMDLIVGLPGETEEDVAYTLERVRTLRPDNLTVHSLALKRASRLREELERYESEAFVQSERIMEMVHGTAKSMGMEPYYLYRQKDIAGNLENVGFAPEGKEGLYNILIMEEVQDIVALGAGAISKRIGQQDMGWMAEKDSLDEMEWRVSDRPQKTMRVANVKDVDQYISRIGEMIERKRMLFESLR